MSDVITDLQQVTPEWLTETLHRAGALESGQVIRVDMDTSRPFGAVVSRLKIEYSHDAPTTVSRRLFLKTGDPETHQNWPERGKHEVEFYGAIPAGDYNKLPLPRCYHAGWSEQGYHLLLDDVGGTHHSIAHPLPPTQRQCEQVVDTLARLAAYWWDDKRLGKSIGSPPDQKAIFDDEADRFPAFADVLGEALWPERRAIYERVIAATHGLQERFRRGNLSLIHGDAHAWNFLYPNDPMGEPLLVDWETWDVDIAVFDLAYLITLFWFPAHRARMEKQLVRRYHERLVEYDVSGYSWDDCWYDYRHSVIRMLFKPVWWWHAGKDSDFWPELWWPRLERVLCAYEDLDCEELLK